MTAPETAFGAQVERHPCGDAELACVRLGPADGQPLLLLRGLGTQLVEWPKSLIDTLLAAGLQLVLADNRDAGLSSDHGSNPQYSARDMAADHIALLDALGLARVHVLGISMGGMLAQHLAMAWPDRLSSMVSVMSSSGAPGLPPPSAEALAALQEPAVDSTATAVISQGARHRAVFGSPGYPESEAQRLAASKRAWQRAWRPDGVARQYQAIMHDSNRWQGLADIRVPTLVIHGADDPLVPLAAGVDTARRIPGARMETIPGMGHNIPEALGATLADLVVGFIKDH